MRSGLYTPEMLRAVDGFDPAAAVRDSYDRAVAEEPIDRMLHADTQLRMPDHSVMILDRMTMAHGLEARSPLLDHRLAEFSARLPMRMKVRGRSLRRIEVMLAQRHLPQAVLDRPKQGFASALPYMLRDEYRLLFDRFLHGGALAREGLVRAAEVERLLSEHAAGQVDHGNRLWLLLNAEVWYRMFLGGASAESLGAAIAEAR
jgi:asparagine synthase (glutamine-hydrolysing)